MRLSVAASVCPIANVAFPGELLPGARAVNGGQRPAHWPSRENARLRFSGQPFHCSGRVDAGG